MERLRIARRSSRGRVAVVDRVTQEARPELGELARLVLGERLGGVEVERPGTRVMRERVEHRQVERERLAAGGAGCDDRVPRTCGLERGGLVRVELLHAARRERLEQRRMQIARQRRELGRLSPDAAGGDELLASGGLRRSSHGIFWMAMAMG